MWGPEFKPFWDHWAINPWLGGVKNGPFWTKNGQTWQACQRSKVVQKGPKGSKMVNLSVFDHLGPFWAHLDPFGPFQTKMNFLPQMGVAEVLRSKKSRLQKHEYLLATKFWSDFEHFRMSGSIITRELFLSLTSCFRSCSFFVLSGKKIALKVTLRQICAIFV